MEKITLSIASDWQKKYIAEEAKAKNLSIDFVGTNNNVFDDLLSLLQQGNCDAIAFEMDKLPLVLPENIVVTAVSKRFSPQYELVIKREKYCEENILGLAADASIAVPFAYLEALLKDVSMQFSYNQVENDAIVQPTFISEIETEKDKNDVNVSLNLREFPPSAAQGVLAYICNKNDADTRRVLKSIHHSDVAMLTNVERSFLKMLNGELCGVHCERDKMNNFHLWAVVIDENQNVIRARASSSTTFGLAETAFQNYNFVKSDLN